jgi:histidine triad (HIT) family protein
MFSEGKILWMKENDQQEKLFEQYAVKENLPSSDPGCAFCRITRGEVPSHVVFKDEISMAFLDRRPVFLGHCLLIPLSHIETFGDTPNEIIGPLFVNAKRLAIAVEKGVKADGTFVAINNKISQSVPHLHVHVVPRRVKDGLRGFFWPRQSYSSEQQALEIQRGIQQAFSESK